MRAFHTAALLGLVLFAGVTFPMAAQDSHPKPGDGIFTPTITPVAAIDKTGRPTTVEVRQPEPRLAQFMVAGKPTGDSYVIKFPTGDAGGPCVYSGTARYFINSSGTLTFQILADCGKLRRGYNYMVCNLDDSLRCREAPWWYFRERRYAITKGGVTVNGSAVYPWNDAAQAPQQLQKMTDAIRSLNDRVRALTSQNVMHGVFISCREFHPESKSYMIHEIATTCAIQSMCDGMPNVEGLRDGDLLDWNSPAGNFVKKQSKTTDFSNWECWIRTQ